LELVFHFELAGSQVRANLSNFVHLLFVLLVQLADFGVQIGLQLRLRCFMGFGMLHDLSSQFFFNLAFRLQLEILFADRFCMLRLLPGCFGHFCLVRGDGKVQLLLQ
jgi:hypothetical protein